MDDRSRIESSQAGREARRRAASSASGARVEAIDTALRRYLAAEEYHQLGESGPAPEDPPGVAEDTG